MRVAFYDIETDSLSVRAARFKIGCAIYSPALTPVMYARTERMVTDLNCCQLIAGHNVIAFDNPIIERLARPITAPVFDLLAAIRTVTGSVAGWGLDSIAAAMVPNEHRWLRAREPADGFATADPIGLAQHCINDVTLFRLVLKACARAAGRLVNAAGETCCIDVPRIGGIPL